MLKVVEKIQVKTISVQWFQTFFVYVLIELSYFIIFYRKLVLGGQINSFAIDVIINILCDKCQIVSVCIKILLFHAIFWDSFVIAFLFFISCENLNFCFAAQTDYFYWLNAVSRNFLKRLLYFSQQRDKRGGNIQTFTTSCRISIIHPRFRT